MALVMLGFMWSMYKGMAIKDAVLAGALLLGAGLLAVNRSQAWVGDLALMRSMIPHHSIAINNARQPSLSDPRVRELADELISSQVRKVADMQRLIEDKERNVECGTAAGAEERSEGKK